MISAQIRAQVRERAQNVCEYCHLHQDDSPLAALHIEHIIPKIHGGSDTTDNLALACIDCNLHKGTNLTGIDPETNEITELFHPRRQAWGDHFETPGRFIFSQCSASLCRTFEAKLFSKANRVRPSILAS
jgi:HNH endonuclease